MVMAKRDGVRTAPFPVTAIDAVALSAQMLAALARFAVRRPHAGTSTLWVNVQTNLTRELIRSFLGHVSTLPIDQFRSIERLFDRLCGVLLPPVVRAHGVEERPLELGGVPGLLYVASDQPAQGVILYLHGGGFIGTSPRMYAAFAARLCRATGCAVFVADYRLAPEYPFPAGMHDAAAALMALQERGVPAERLFIAGDSSGGGLANSLLLAGALTKLTCRPAGVILFSPQVDMHLREPSIRDNEPYDILPWNIPTAVYLQGEDPSHDYFDHHEADLSGFPPTFVVWGANEMFRDAIRGFVERLKIAQVLHEEHESIGMFHAFPILMPWMAESRFVYRKVAGFVRAILAGAPRLDPVVTRI